MKVQSSSRVEYTAVGLTVVLSRTHDENTCMHDPQRDAQHETLHSCRQQACGCRGGHGKMVEFHRFLKRATSSGADPFWPGRGTCVGSHMHAMQVQPNHPSAKLQHELSCMNTKVDEAVQCMASDRWSQTSPEQCGCALKIGPDGTLMAVVQP